MQTFLPYPDLECSVASLDGPRLGKQRVETLQLLRASLLPTYGWQNHPVTLMWRGHMPGLVAYGLASVREWVARGHSDSTEALIREFAPEVAGLDQRELEDRGLLPPWFGDEDLHRSHRSNLIRKDPGFYAPLFPGTPPDLDYVWPPAPPSAAPEAPVGRPVWIVRASEEDEAALWREANVVAIGERSPRGTSTPAWRAQVAAFLEAVGVGDEIGILVANGAVVQRAVVTGEVRSLTGEKGVRLARPVDYAGRWRRTDFSVPAALQNPRSLFQARLRDDAAAR